MFYPKFPQAQINGFVKNPFGCADVSLGYSGYYSTNISWSWAENKDTIHSLSKKCFIVFSRDSDLIKE